MAEYYAVLKKAVGGLEGASSEARRAVYDKARNALIGQLKAIDPPLSTSEISRQRLELEEAIRRVERESAMEAQSARGRPGESAAAPIREAVMEAPAGPSPQDVFRRAIQEAETRAATAPLERAAVQPRADAYGNEARSRTDRTPPPDYSPPYPPPEADYRARSGSAQPRLAPDYEDEVPRHAAAPEIPPSPYVDRRDRPRQAARSERRSYREDEDRAVAERPVRRSRLPAILLTLLIIGMAGGLAALGWSQRSVIRDLVASFDNKSQVSAGAPAAAPSGEAASASKSDDRLGDGGEVEAPSDNVRVVQPQGAPTDTPAAATPSADPGSARIAAAPEPGETLVAQKATLLEEQSGSSNGENVTAITAHVTWRFVDGKDGPEVEADVDIPDRSMKVRLAFRRNNDATLPASHLVEATITTPADFPGQGIRAIPRLVMKNAEDSRGQPLIGASAKVADGFFWIALSAAESDVAANLKLMREANWVDLPMVYENGQRAILSMEKGTPGARAFETALTTWGG